MTSIESIQSLILDLPPSCIEFCSEAPEYFVVGTYFLEKKEQETASERDEDEDGQVGGQEKQVQTRTGTLVLFRLDGDELTQISTTPTPYAILDLHFSPHSPKTLAVAGSTGNLDLFNLDTPSQSLTKTHTIQIFDPEILVLSLAWHPVNPRDLGITASNGGVYMINLPSSPSASASDTKPEVVMLGEEPIPLLQHDLEAWTLCFSQSDDNTNDDEQISLFSGGDDAKLQHLSLPTTFNPNTSTSSTSTSNNETPPTQKWQDQRIHTAGVTAILPLPNQPNVVLTGSYDDNIRVVNTVHPGRKQILCEKDLGGGVWRLRLLDCCLSSRQRSSSGPGPGKEVQAFTVLASCMHAGARIVQVIKKEDGEWDIEVLATFEEHKSMNYGSDVQPNSQGRTVVSTSFYDRLLCLWRW